ncbi:hypothetical protein LCGC14_1583340 [marine sediment metagenome]|uniref:Uncharacterized protein n=1 Tax=marine sediment metagenome TaxID=412755 RepID=A0A0F9LGF0_9ZZZZ
MKAGDLGVDTQSPEGEGTPPEGSPAPEGTEGHHSEEGAGSPDAGTPPEGSEAGAEGGEGEAVLGGHSTDEAQTALALVAPSSAPSLSTKEESDGQDDSVLSGDGRGRNLDVSSGPSPLTHDQRVAPSWHPWKDIDDAGIEAEAQRLRTSEVHRQFEVGDFAIWLEKRVGPEAASLILETCPFKSVGEPCPSYEHRHDMLGYQPESFGNIVYVCSRIPEELRRPKLRFSHHVVVAPENHEDIAMWLDECEEGWPVSEFRRRVKGTKPRVKRYSLEELRQKAREFGFAEWAEIGQFLEGLEEQG